MRSYRTVAAALLAFAAMCSVQYDASAQSFVRNNRARYASAPPAPTMAEELPPGRIVPGPKTPTPAMDPFVDDGGGGFAPDHFQPDGGFYDGGYGGYGDCCDGPCGGYPCGGSCGTGCCSTCNDCGSCGGWFAFGDYLYMRAHFSDAPAYVERISANTNPPTVTQLFHQLDFDWESSFRVGGGYRLCDCGEELRFTFTRMTSSADSSVTAPGQTSGTVILLPYTPTVLEPGDEAFINADVDINTFDFEYRKTIPLGGMCGSSCGDPCGCGNTCGCDCPAWDITWSGGVRGTNVDWRRSYEVEEGPNSTQTSRDSFTTSHLEFNGAGPRAGLEGRRYFGCNGCVSMYLKGDLSLLFGHVDLTTIQNREIANVEVNLIESLRTREIIPVTEFEAGMTANLTCHSSITTGYMLSAWHDLGFREEATLPTLQLNQSYDDANILSFDGFFFRAEWSY